MPRHRRAAVVVGLDVVLARPDRLHRGGRHRLSDADGEVDVVERERQAPAEAATEHEVREMDVLHLEAECLGGGGARVQRILHAGPHLGPPVLHLRRAHHRLHRRVGEKRRAIVGGDGLCRVLRQLGRRAKRAVERREDRRGGNIAVPGIGEGRLHRRHRPARAPEAVGDDGHRIGRASRSSSRPASPRPASCRRAAACRHSPAPSRWRRRACPEW